MKIEFIYEADVQDFSLTPQEEEIMKHLRKLNALWKKSGHRLILFAGSDLSIRVDKPSKDHEIESFPNVRCDGGDGADNF
jgi:hypothetical protein